MSLGEGGIRRFKRARGAMTISQARAKAASRIIERSLRRAIGISPR